MSSSYRVQRRLPGGLLFLLILGAAVSIALGIVANARPAGAEPGGSLDMVATDYLREATGWNCQVRRTSFGPPLEDDAAAQEQLRLLGGRPGWVYPGSVYAGTADQAVAAFGGKLIVSTADEQWIVTEEQGRLTATMLSRAEETEAGFVWVRRTTITAVPDAECA